MIKRSHWSIPYFIFMVLFVVMPMLLVLVYAFQSSQGGFTFANIARFFTDRDAIATFGVSIEIAIENTLICLLFGYPAAWILANKKLNRSAVTVVLFIMPMWINALMRTLATAELFNMLGVTLGKGTLLFGMVYDYLPFMILPIYTAMTKIDDSIIEAAQDLGCNVWQILFRVLVPLTGPGIATGITQVFVPAVSTFIISRMLGGGSNLLIGDLIELQFLGNSYNLNLGSAMSLVLMVIVLLCMSFTSSFDESEMEGVM